MLENSCVFFAALSFIVDEGFRASMVILSRIDNLTLRYKLKMLSVLVKVVYIFDNYNMSMSLFKGRRKSDGSFDWRNACLESRYGLLYDIRWSRRCRSF